MNDIFSTVIHVLSFAAGYIVGCIVMHHFDKQYYESGVHDDNDQDSR